METRLHDAHVRVRLHSDDDVVEEALAKHARTGRGVRQPRRVVHVVAPRGQAFTAQDPHHQKRRVADEHVLADRIRRGREQILCSGLAEHDDLRVALHVVGREEHARLRRPVVHERKVLAGADHRDRQILIIETQQGRHRRFRNGHGDARHAADRRQIFRQEAGDDIG